MSETVCKDCGTAIHPWRFKCWPCWQKQTGREIPEYAKDEAELHERRLPSSQPEKVEPRVGQTWKGRMGDVETMLSEASDRRGEWYTASGCIVTPKWFEHATLISTGEAEKRTGLLDVGAAD